VRHGGQGFGATIRGLREEKRIGLRQFARTIGVSATYLSKIERGEMPPPAEDRVKEIARRLDQDPDELLALAGKVASDLNEIIRSQPRGMASFLRTASGLSGQELERLTKQAVRSKEARTVTPGAGT
jgi:HTH-type transcriptional regulator, competence development regulator